MNGSLELSGVWTYRSLANAPDAGAKFDDLKVWEAELSFEVTEDGRIYGFLGERPPEAKGDEPYLTVEGLALEGDPIRVTWRAIGWR